MTRPEFVASLIASGTPLAGVHFLLALIEMNGMTGAYIAKIS